MKKILPLILIIFIFSAGLLYLHQKVQIYVEAYRLNNNYHYHAELVDKRDYLMYNFAKEVSLVKLNQWAKTQNFAFVSQKMVVDLDRKRRNPAVNNKIVLLLDRFLSASSSTSTVLAKDKE